MNMSVWIRISLTAVLMLATIARAQSPSAHVILISIDGFAAYHLRDPNLLLPNIRTMIKEGVWAESSETVFPSVTHPAHTTMITGVAPRVHGVLNNNMRNRETGDSFHVTNKARDESIKAATLFDAARNKGLSTASFFWPETRSDRSILYNLPETFDAKGNPDAGAVDPGFLRELRDAGVPVDLYFRFYGDLPLKGAADAVLAQSAAHVIRTHRPNLLTIHFLVTDSTQHTYGPNHYLSRAALTMADHCVGILMQAVRDSGIGDRTTFIVAADHGFHSVEWDVNLHGTFEQSGLLDRISIHPAGWSAWVELGKGFDPARDRAGLEKALDQVRKLPGIARIVPPEELHSLGLPKYEEDPHVPGHYLIVGDIDTHLVFDPRKSSSGRLRKDRPYHGHGYLPSHPRMFPSLVLSGSRIDRGRKIGHVSNYDIAPTIARLLGLDMKDLPGRVLEEALEKR